MELNYLKVFYEVAKTGKFAITAKKLNISQSALSRSVSLLEEAQGVVLFERSKDGVNLTEKGEEIYRLCEKLFQIEKEIENTCKGIKEECSGILRIASQDHIINDFLTDRIGSLRRKNRKLALQFMSGSSDEIVNSVLNQEAEFGLLFAKVVTPQIEFIKVEECKMSLVCSSELWKKCRSSSTNKTLQKILQEYGYISSINAIKSSRSIYLLTEIFGEVPNVGIEINSQESQKRMVMASEGIAYLANFMVQEEIKKGVLHEIELFHENVLNLWLAKPKNRVLSNNAKVFIKECLNMNLGDI